jgi:hypothetical protein
MLCWNISAPFVFSPHSVRVDYAIRNDRLWESTTTVSVE